MARTVTLLQLRTAARQRADQENSTLCTDSEVNTYINTSLTELWDLLVSAYGEGYFESEISTTTTPGTYVYPVNVGFYKLIRVDATISGRTVTLGRVNSADEKLYTANGNGPPLKYRLQYGNIRLVPTPDAAYTITYTYVPVPVALSADGDTFDGVDGWDEYIVIDVARKLALKEENFELVQALLMDKAAMKDRIMRMGQTRDIGEPQTIRMAEPHDDYLDNVISGQAWP